eukprot:1902813-Prymnesium_polylepis.1
MRRRERRWRGAPSALDDTVDAMSTVRNIEGLTAAVQAPRASGCWCRCVCRLSFLRPAIARSPAYLPSVDDVERRAGARLAVAAVATRRAFPEVRRDSSPATISRSPCMQL